jgi:hypothetical protein
MIPNVCQIVDWILFGYPHFAGDQSRSCLVIHTLQETNRDLVWLSTLCRRPIGISFGYPHFAGDQSRSCLVIHTLQETNHDLVWLSTLCRRANSLLLMTPNYLKLIKCIDFFEKCSKVQNPGQSIRTALALHADIHNTLRLGLCLPLP